MKTVAYFMIALSCISAGFLSVSVGPFQLSLYRGLLIILFLTVVIKDIKQGRMSLHCRKDNRYSAIFITFWLIYAVLSVLWVKDYSAWFKAVFFIASGFMSMVVLLHYFRSQEDILDALRAFLPLIFFHNIIGWYEWITGRYPFLQGERLLTYQRVRYPVSTFGNTNDFGLFLVFSCFILFVCFICSRRKVFRISYITVILSSFVLIFFTKSRASLIGLIIGIVFLLFVSFRKRDMSRIVITLFFIALLILIIKPNLVMTVLDKIDTLLTFDFSLQTGSEFVRINLIKNGIEFFISTIGFGTGAGNIEYWMENYALYYVATVYNIHNWWLEILVSFGIFVFAGYIVFFTKLMLSLWHRFRHSTEKGDAVLSIGILSIMIAYIIASISSSSNLNSEWLWVFWGIAIAYQGVQPKTTEMTESEQPNIMRSEAYHTY